MASVVFTVIWGLLFFGPVVLWLVMRKGGYKRQLLDQVEGPGWEITDERSVDPVSGEVIAVWFNPRTGQRAYVRAGRPPA